MAEESLADLLRKCHRDELLPLARLLRIEPQGMALGTLANAIDLQLRRVATNQVFSVLSGRPPPYSDVLRGVGRRLHLSLPRDPATAELAIVRYQVRHAWKELAEEEREARWQEVARPFTAEDAPVDPELLLSVLDHRAPHGIGFHLANLVNKPPVPLPGCLLLLWLARPRDEIALPAIAEVCRLRQTVRHRVTVGIVGSPSSGKDAAIGALFGLPTGNVDPVAGSTREVEIRRVPGSTALYLVNTPGMGDVVESVTEQARQVLDHIDVFVYLVNAQGGVQAREKADHEACVRRGRPVLVVVNKVDTLRPADRDRFVEDCRVKLRAAPEDVIPAAFDPLPQLAEAPIGVAEVRGWIEERLGRLGKDRTELPWNAGARTPALAGA